MARLKKSDVERLTADYDSDPVAALGRALATILGTGDGSWDELIRRCGFGTVRRTALLARDDAALGDLLRDLIELRAVPPDDADHGDAITA